MRVLFAIALLFALLSVNAQETIKLDKNQLSYTLTGGTADTINGATTWSVIFDMRDIKNGIGRYTVAKTDDIDTLDGGGGNNVTSQLQGSYDGTNYENIGSAITYGASDDTIIIAKYNTYTEVGAAYNILGGGLGTDTIFTQSDTINIPAITTTVTLPGYDYNFIKELLTGASSARVEIQSVNITAGKVD